MSARKGEKANKGHILMNQTAIPIGNKVLEFVTMFCYTGSTSLECTDCQGNRALNEKGNCAF